MKYVRFTGSTPYPHTSYIQEQIFNDDATLEEIKFASKMHSIDNATLHAWMFSSEDATEAEINDAYQDYISACIDRGKWEFIDENED